MSPRNFVILAGATAVSLALAIGAIVGRDVPVTAQPAATALFPGLIDRANEVRTVRVTGPDARTITLEAGEQGWKLKEKGGYPVKAEEVRKLVLGLAGLQLVEAKTAQPDRLQRLELEDPAGGKDAKSRLIELLAQDGQPVASAVVGKSKPGLYGGGRSGVYVRRAGEAQSWLAAGSLELPGDGLDLAERQVVDFPMTRIARVTLGLGGPSPIRIHRPDTDTLPYDVDAAPPEGREIDRDKVEQVAGSLGLLTFQDVKPVAGLALPPDARRTRYETFDGLAVEVTAARIGEGDAAERWVTLSVAALDPATAAAPSPAAPPAGEQVAGTAQPAGDTAAQPAEKPAAERAAELDARVRGWAYKVSPYVGDRLGADLEALLADRQDAS
jgi:hypothetical protein